MSGACKVAPKQLAPARQRGVEPVWSPSKVIAVSLGAPLAAFALGALCVRSLPIGAAPAFAVGFHLMVPLWLALASTLGLARNGRAALAGCVAVSALCALLLWLVDRS